MTTIKYAALCLLLLAGCTTNKPTDPPPLADVILVPEKQKVNIPEQTLRDCDPIPRLEARAYKEGEILKYMQPVVTVMADCRKRKRDAVDSLRKAFNTSK